MLPEGDLLRAKVWMRKMDHLHHIAKNRGFPTACIMQDSASDRGLFEHHSCKCTSFSRQNSGLSRNSPVIVVYLQDFLLQDAATGDKAAVLHHCMEIRACDPVPRNAAGFPQSGSPVLSRAEARHCAERKSNVPQPRTLLPRRNGNSPSWGPFAGSADRAAHLAVHHSGGDDSCAQPIPGRPLPARAGIRPGDRYSRSASFSSRITSTSPGGLAWRLRVLRPRTGFAVRRSRALISPGFKRGRMASRSAIAPLI